MNLDARHSRINDTHRFPSFTMDLYTTSFSYPRPTPHALRSSSSPLAPSALNLPGSASVSSVPLPNVTSSTTPSKKTSSSTPLTTAAQVEKDWDAVQKLALDITSREGCLVTVTKEETNTDLGAALPTTSTGSAEDEIVADTTVWNFHLSGGVQSVMAARGAILREIPRDNRTVLKVARTDMLESPLATVSPLKPDVKKRLDDIAADSKALITVLNLATTGNGGVGGIVLATADGSAIPSSPAAGSSTEATTQTITEDGSAPPTVDEAATSEAIIESTSVKPTETQDPAAGPTSGQVTYGLETERMCELVITGPIESVEIAKVRLLVMLDELVNRPPLHVLTPVRLAFRGMRHRLQAPRYYRVTQTIRHSIHSGRDRHKYLLPYSSCRRTQPSAARSIAGRIPQSRYGTDQCPTDRYRAHADDWQHTGDARYKRHESDGRYERYVRHERYARAHGQPYRNGYGQHDRHRIHPRTATPAPTTSAATPPPAQS